MTDLAGAVATAGGSFKKTELLVGYGSHKGYFEGLGDTVTEKTNFPCNRCKGEGIIKGEDCRGCEGSGKKTTTKVPLLYRLAKDLVQEEWVTYTLSEPGKLANGQPKSASTLWIRMRALSGLSDPAAISQWYAELPQPVKVPIEVMVSEHASGEGFAIASVRKFEKGAPAPDPEPNPLDDEPPF